MIVPFLNISLVSTLIPGRLLRPAAQFLMGLSILSLSACASTNSTSGPLADGEFYTQDFPEVTESILAINAQQDRFRIGDIADIYVYDVESLTNNYPVDREGNITLPLIGTQEVAGLTTLELQKQLMAEYGETYLQNPSITVKREATTLGNIVVDGAVSKPGVFELFNPINLSEAVAMAGGLTTDADQKSIFLVREVEGKRRVKEVNLKDIRSLGANDPEVYPSDIVFVHESSGRRAYNDLIKSLPLLSTLILVSTR